MGWSTSISNRRGPGIIYSQEHNKSPLLYWKKTEGNHIEWRIWTNVGIKPSKGSKCHYNTVVINYFIDFLWCIHEIKTLVWSSVLVRWFLKSPFTYLWSFLVDLKCLFVVANYQATVSFWRRVNDPWGSSHPTVYVCPCPGENSDFPGLTGPLCIVRRTSVKFQVFQGILGIPSQLLECRFHAGKNIGII